MDYLILVTLAVLLQYQNSVLSAPLDDVYEPPKIEVLRQEISPSSHTFLYELTDGQYREEKIEILNEGTDTEEIVITGKYSFIGSDGLTYEVNYKADRNGYVVMSKGLASIMPVAFAIPSSVLKSLIG